jgi:lambda family phage tail tape measure protein
MANKVLSIAVKVADQATAPLRSIGAGIMDMARRAAAAASNVVKVATSFKSLLTAGAGVLALLQGFRAFRGWVDWLDEFGEKARTFDLAVQDLSVLEYAAKRANVSLDELAGAFKKGQINLADFAATGKGTAADAMKMLGVRATDASGRVRSLYELIPEIGQALDDRRLGQAEKLRVLTDIFGKQGAAIERLIASGNLAEYRRELERLGGIITPSQVAVAARVSDALDRLAVAYRGVVNQLVLAAGPNIEKFLNALAFKLAEMPDRVRAIGWAISEVLSRGPQAQQAQDAIMAIVKRAGSALGTTLMEIAKLLVSTMIDAFTAAFTIVAPKLATLLQDALGSVAGWAGFTKSTGGQLRDVQEELRTLRATNAERDKILEKEKEERALRFTLATEDRANAEARDKAMRDLWFNTGRNALAAGAEIRAAWGGFDDAQQALVNLYKEANPQTTSAPGGDPQPAAAGFGVSMRDMLASVSKYAADGTAKVQQWLAKWNEFLARQKAIAGELRGLEARALDATGNRDAAERLRLIIRHEEERAAVLKRYGDTAKQLADRLREVQRLELERFDADVAARAADEAKSDPVRKAGNQPMTIVQGIRAGFLQATESVRDFGRIGMEVASSVTTSFASGLTQAIWDFASGTEKAGKAFSKFALQFIASTGQMILQMLILRSIMGAFGFGAAPAGVNTGGRITHAGVRKFANGGGVPGPNVNADVVPAMLTPGEWVISRRGVRANDPATLAYMNMGGRVTPAGGAGAAQSGGGVNVTQHVTLEGGGTPSQGTLKQLKDATMQGVLEALRTSPSFKSTMKAALA